MTDAVDYLSNDAIAIFLFHGVINHAHDGVRNYTRKHLLLDEFEEVVRLLARAGSPLSIDDALDALAGEAPLPRKSFVLTFDDGFRNNLTVAAPVLARLELPAVFYVTTGFLADNSPSWIDWIEFAVERATVTEIDLVMSASRLTLEASTRAGDARSGTRTIDCQT